MEVPAEQHVADADVIDQALLIGFARRLSLDERGTLAGEQPVVPCISVVVRALHGEVTVGGVVGGAYVGQIHLAQHLARAHALIRLRERSGVLARGGVGEPVVREIAAEIVPVDESGWPARGLLRRSRAVRGVGPDEQVRVIRRHARAELIDLDGCVDERVQHRRRRGCVRPGWSFLRSHVIGSRCPLRTPIAARNREQSDTRRRIRPDLYPEHVDPLVRGGRNSRACPSDPRERTFVWMSPLA